MATDITDTLFMRCHLCEYQISEKVPRNQTLPPWRVIRWHERMINHVWNYHSRKREKV